MVVQRKQPLASRTMVVLKLMESKNCHFSLLAWSDSALSGISGLLVGNSYWLLIMELLKYITDAYRQFTALVHAAASTVRPITAVCLPLAGSPMCGKPGIHWAC